MEQLKLIELKNISKAFDGDMVLENLDLYILKNEFITLLGPSGCGKTTGVGNISDGTLENYYTSFGYIGEEIFSSEQEPAHIYVYTHLFGEGKQRYLRFSSERDEKARIWQEKIADNA